MTLLSSHVSRCGTASSRAPSNFRSTSRAPMVLGAISMLHLTLALGGCETSLPSTRVDAAGHADAARTDDAATTDDAAIADAATLDGATGDDASIDGGPADAGTLPTCDCFAGAGTYCEADVAARAASEGCTALDARADGRRLLSCDEATGWTSTATCAAGCESGESGATSECSLPVCACFVREAWCGASAGRHGLTLDPPCRVPLVPEHDTDILGCDGPTWIVRTACEEGCFEAPTGVADACVDDRGTPTDPGWPACAHRSLLHSGLHPEASDRLRCAGVESSRISQTVGSAPASAGYHAADGTADGRVYTAAVDLRTRDLSTAEIRTLLARLGENGFAAWYRQPGSDGWPSGEAPHIHAVFAGVVMKAALRAQVRDWLVGRNGLASHTRYGFWTPTAGTREIVRLLFTRHYTP